jgi:hypothetical protein
MYRLTLTVSAFAVSIGQHTTVFAYSLSIKASDEKTTEISEPKSLNSISVYKIVQIYIN